MPGSCSRALSSLSLNPPENPVKPVRLTPSLYVGGHGFGEPRPGGPRARTLSASACPQSPGSALCATSPPPPQTLWLLPHPVTHPAHSTLLSLGCGGHGPTAGRQAPGQAGLHLKSCYLAHSIRLPAAEHRKLKATHRSRSVAPSDLRQNLSPFPPTSPFCKKVALSSP